MRMFSQNDIRWFAHFDGVLTSHFVHGIDGDLGFFFKMIERLFGQKISSYGLLPYSLYAHVIIVFPTSKLEHPSFYPS
jgi:hypothetical protein